MERLPRLQSSRPYAWPLSGAWRPDNTAVLVIDMQQDFLAADGYFGIMGYSTAAARAIIEPVTRIVSALRALGVQIIYTREGHRPDLADLTAMKRQRSASMGAAIGSPGPLGRFLVRGQSGWDLIPEMAPQSSDVLLDKPGNGSFYGTDLDQILRSRGIRKLVLTGVTTDVCVHSTLREANDRGFECLLLEDCCAASDPELHRAAVEMTLREGGIFGAVATSHDVLAALSTMNSEPERGNLV